jgi:NAD(P)-dependent dehydrogenase (short-subunit alcohol dehydrogenase family)
MSDTRKKVAIVVGASGGIGHAVVLRMAKDGFAVAAHYAGNATKAEEVVAAIKAAGGNAIATRRMLPMQPRSSSFSRPRSTLSAGSMSLSTLQGSCR